MPMPVKVIVDKRERNDELFEGLKSRGAEISFDTLHVGDYVVSDRICIERKTVPDFESSIMNGRLFEQLERLREHYDFPILVLEGNRNEARLDRNVINGTIASIYVDYSIPVMMSEGPGDTAEIIFNVAKREQNGTVREPSLKGAARAYTQEQFKEYVIGNLPGVGPKLAKSLLKHFGTVRSITNANIEELMEVEKIGEKKAERIHEILNKRYVREE